MRPKHPNEERDPLLDEGARHVQPNRQILRLPIERRHEWHTSEDSHHPGAGHVRGRVAPSGGETATADIDPTDALSPLSGGRQRRHSSDRARPSTAHREKRTKERRPSTGAPVLTNLQASRAFRQRCVAAGLVPAEPSAATLAWVADLVYETLRQAHREQAAACRRQRETRHQSSSAVA